MRALILLLFLPFAGCLSSPGEPQAPEGYELAGVSGVELNKDAALLTLETSSGRTLTMVVSRAQGERILLSLGNRALPRPDAAQLFIQLSRVSGTEVKFVTIDSLKEGIYYATLHLHGGEMLDSRPSDAVIIALRLGREVYISQELLEKEKEEGEVRKIKLKAVGGKPVLCLQESQAAPRSRLYT